MKLSHVLCFGCFILGSFGAQSAPTNVGATETQNSPPGTPSCDKCPAGHHVQDHCDQTLNQSTACAPCDDQTYSSQANGDTYCTPCTLGNCPKNSVEVHACNTTIDILCLCDEGFYQLPFDNNFDPNFNCLIHSTCEPGQGEAHGGNHSHNRKCETCEVGKTFRFVDATGPERPVCRACSPCDDGSHVTVACSLHNDTQCSHGNATSAPDVVTSPPPDDSASDSDHADRIHSTVGAVLGVFFGLLLLVGLPLIVLAMLRCRRKRKRAQELGQYKAVTKTEKAENGDEGGESTV